MHFITSGRWKNPKTWRKDGGAVIQIPHVAPDDAALQIWRSTAPCIRRRRCGRERDFPENEMPHSREVESADLGSIMLDDAHCDEVAQSISPSDFYLAPHRKIYGAMRNMREEGKAIDPLSLAEELDRKGRGGR